MFLKKVKRTQAVINFTSRISTVYFFFNQARIYSLDIVTDLVFANSLLLWEMLEWLSKTAVV